MLFLPADWSHFPAGSVAAGLFGQLDSCLLRTKFAGMIIHAALKLFVETFPKRHRFDTPEIDAANTINPNFRLIRRNLFHWRINQLYYIYLDSASLLL